MKAIRKCGRCGIVEKRGQVFEKVSDFHLCVDCSQIAYKAKDALYDGDVSSANTLFDSFKEGVVDSPTEQSVLDWINGFKQSLMKKQIADLEKFFADFLNKHKALVDGELNEGKARLYLDLIKSIEKEALLKLNSEQLQNLQKSYKYIGLILDYCE